MPGVPAIKLAYLLDGTPVPYDSEKANVKIRIRGNSVRADYKDLPQIWYNYHGGRRIVKYIPHGIEERIDADLQQHEIKDIKWIKFQLIFLLPHPEEVARAKAKMMEEVYKGLRPASGALLNTRMSF